MKIHTGVKPYNCVICEKQFSHSSHLTTHMRVHTGVKPFKCAICEYQFSQNSTLTTHMKVHTGVKPFKCAICENQFSQNSHLTKHMKVHTGEKPFKCAVCEKQFAENDTLKEHMTVHTGEKPFRCDFCEKKFSRKDKLTKHIKNKHNSDLNVKCEVKVTTVHSKRLIVNIERTDYSEYLIIQNKVAEKSNPDPTTEIKSENYTVEDSTVAPDTDQEDKVNTENSLRFKCNESAVVCKVAD